MFCMRMTLSTYARHACERGGAAQQRVYPDFEASRSVIIARAKQQKNHCTILYVFTIVTLPKRVQPCAFLFICLNKV